MTEFQTGVSTSVDASQILRQLSATVLLPLLLGQLARRAMEFKRGAGKPTGLGRQVTSKLGIVSQVWNSYTFARGKVNFSHP